MTERASCEICGIRYMREELELCSGCGDATCKDCIAKDEENLEFVESACCGIALCQTNECYEQYCDHCGKECCAMCCEAGCDAQPRCEDNVCEDCIKTCPQCNKKACPNYVSKETGVCDRCISKL